MIVIADSGPLRYLVLIDQVHLLPKLFGYIVVPNAVFRELSREATPESVKAWISQPPDWLMLRSPKQPLPAMPSFLGEGEKEAIALAEELSADALLMDDEAARSEAERRKIRLQGTLGILDLAAEHGLLADFTGAIQRLSHTNFRASRKLIAFFAEREEQRKKLRAKIED